MQHLVLCCEKLELRHLGLHLVVQVAQLVLLALAVRLDCADEARGDGGGPIVSVSSFSDGRVALL